MRKISESSARQQFKVASSTKIGYVSLNVSNILRSLDFYKNILGFKVVSRPSRKKAILSVDGASSHLIELLQVERNANNNNDTFNLLGTTKKRAGLYHFAILLPARKYLADMLQNLRDKRDQVHFDGFADHLVSESVYIRDPDFNGIEIYRDRPMSEWNWDGNRIEMATLPLNTSDLLKESTDKGWKEMPSKTTIGHVHLHVKDLAEALKFYHEILGLNLTATIPNAAFFAAGKYHHHIAVNTWLGTNILPASPQGIGLNHFSIELPSKAEYERLVRQLSRYGIGIEDLSERSVFVQDMDGMRVRLQHE
jgi:catechol 2,3-dioxygenase